MALWILDRMKLEKAKEWNWTTILHQTPKLTQNALKIWVRPEAIKCLEHNIGSKHLGTDFSKDFSESDLKSKRNGSKNKTSDEGLFKNPGIDFIQPS